MLGQFVVNDGQPDRGHHLRLNDELRHQPRRAGGGDDQPTRAARSCTTRRTDHGRSAFDGYADEITAVDPDAIIVIGFDESSLILRSLVEKGIGPRDKHVYGYDGNIGNALGVDFDTGN